MAHFDLDIHHSRRTAVRVALPALLAASLVLVAATRGLSGPLPPSGLPGCSTGTMPAPSARYDEWASTLLDPTRGVDAAYVPPDLQSRIVAGRAVTLRSFVFGALQQMLHAASNDGVTIMVNSGYRSHAQQARLAREMADEPDIVARAGHSEHQLGTSVDLSGGAAWLAQNAWRFGFAMSYPADRSPAWTCYPHEPWHFRFFGRERAEAIRASGLSPREWLWRMLTPSVT